MGVLGWVARRVLAILIFAPLFGLWYAVLTRLVDLPPGFLGLGENALGELVLVAFVAALITDILIMRVVKRAMKRRKAPPA
jgi:hypothetical protein